MDKKLDAGGKGDAPRGPKGRHSKLSAHDVPPDINVDNVYTKKCLKFDENVPINTKTQLPPPSTSLSSSQSSSAYSLSPTSSDHSQSSATLSLFDRAAYLKRLFKKQPLGINSHNVTITYTEDFWMSTVVNQTLFLELGHAQLEHGKDGLVQLIDDAFDDSEIDQIVIYFQNCRSDFKQLVRTFRFYDFSSVLGSEIERQFILSEGNHYMVYDTRASSDSADDSDESDEDLIDFD